MSQPVDIAIIGFGFMGATHASVYRLLPAARVVAIVDPRLEHTRAAIAARQWEIPVFPDYASAAANCKFSAVDICLPTDLHGDVARRAFADGRHVFCEKPIALTLDAAREMIAAAQGAQRQLMIGHCIRFWPEYAELKRLVDSGAQGRLLSLSMSRRTGRPGYTAGNWVNQPGRCLGAALDLHIHDTDFLSHLLGTPRAVVSQGIEDETGWSSITTQYHFGDLLVSAEAAWNYPPKWGFQMRFAAVFERAVLDFDSRNTPSLTLTVGDSSPAPVTVPQTPGALGGYYHELAYFVDCVRRDVPVTISTGEQATESLRVVLAEIESAQMKKPVHLNP